MSTNIKKQNVQATSKKPTKTVVRKKEDDKEEKKKTLVTKTSGVGKMGTASASGAASTLKKRIPNSPTSSRVSKSQYYPDKTLYSNALSSATPKIKQSLMTMKTTSRTTKPAVKKVGRDVSTDRTSKVQKSRDKVAPVPVPVPSKRKTLAEVKKEMREKLDKPTGSLKTGKSVKTVKNVKSPDSSSSSQLDRPRTATLKRPSIVSTNIAGPEADTVSITESIVTQPETDTEVYTESIVAEKTSEEVLETEVPDTDDYEDDFDSYASDFEEYNSSDTSSEPLDVTTDGEETSSDEDLREEEPEPSKDSSTPPRRINSAEEERKLDSGNFDMPQDGSAEPKKMQILDRIKEHEPVLSSLSDEGFEEQKTSLQFVNFADAKKARQRQKSRQKTLRRGEELMSMIRLDQQNFTLFDVPAQSYDAFIKSFGNRNSAQVASQTGNERVDEEVQTDRIECVNKWTQFPIDKITKSKNPLQFREELLGVGSDTIEVNLLKEHQILEYNEYNLAKFLQTQERLICELLKENQYGTKADMTSGKFPFSQGYHVLDTDDLGACKSVTFSNSNKNPKIITIHDVKDLKSRGFVWSLTKPRVPEDSFAAFGDMSDVTFGLDNDKLIFGGFKDGSLAAWDLLEDIITEDQNGQTSRPPSYLTDVDFGSTEEVVKVLCFRPLKSNDFQVITLNETGKIVIWALIISPTEGLGLNRISLIRSNTIFLGVQHQTGPSLQCTDLCLSQSDPNHFYVSTNLGVILHSLVSGTRTNPRQYNSGLASVVNALEGCPHNSRYFLAGCQSGEVILHSKQFEKPLMTISNQVSDAAILQIQWSRNRPCVFYTLDKDDNINVWDLSVSELYPQITVHLKEKIRELKVSPLKSETSYMAVVTGDGKLHLHLLSQEHGMQEVEVYDGDLRKLNGYVQKL